MDAAKGKDKSKQRMGSANGRFKGGISSDYRRRITGAKKGQLVHHLDEDKSNNKLSNFKIEKPSGGMSAIGHHNQDHPSKAVAGGKARARGAK